MQWQAAISAGLKRIRIRVIQSGIAMSRVDFTVAAPEQAGEITRWSFLSAAGDAFDVWGLCSVSTATVGFAGWHEEFRNPDDDPLGVVRLVAWGLSSDCKLRIASAGRTDFRWDILVRRDAQWQPYSQTGLLLFPWFSKRRVRELQNAVLSWNEAEWKNPRQ